MCLARVTISDAALNAPENWLSVDSEWFNSGLEWSLRRRFGAVIERRYISTLQKAAQQFTLRSKRGGKGNRQQYDFKGCLTTSPSVKCDRHTRDRQKRQGFQQHALAEQCPTTLRRLKRFNGPPTFIAHKLNTASHLTIDGVEPLSFPVSISLLFIMR